MYYLCGRFVLNMTLVTPVSAVGYNSTSAEVTLNCFVIAHEDDTVNIWDDQRRKNHRRNWKSFRHVFAGLKQRMLC